MRIKLKLKKNVLLGVSYEIITNAYKQQLQIELAHPESNTDIINWRKHQKLLFILQKEIYHGTMQ